MTKNDEDRKRDSEPKLVIPPLKKCPFCHGSAKIERGLLDTEDETKKRYTDMPLYACSVCTECNAMSCVFEASVLHESDPNKHPVEIMQVLVCKAAYAWNRRA